MNALPSTIRPADASPAIVPSDVSVDMPMDSPHLSVASAVDPGDPPLTRVSLAYVEHRINLYLRFGHPSRTVELDRWRRVAVFLPTAVFCRIRWESNDYGTTRWQLMVLQAGTGLDTLQRVPGIAPGARILLHTEGEPKVKAVLQRIDAIEALGVDPVDAAPAYWRTLGNRLSARLVLPDYTPERHAAWLAGRALQ
jgi:hypothetical protein